MNLSTAQTIRPQVLSLIPDDIDPVRETLKHMRKLALAGRLSPSVRSLAEQIVRDVRPKSWRDEIQACFDYVRDTVRYLRDPTDAEMLHTAHAVMDTGQSDCDGQAVFLAALLMSIGHPTRFFAMGFAPHDYTHVTCQALHKRTWINCDTTEDYPMGWLPDGIVCVQIIHNKRGCRS